VPRPLIATLAGLVFVTVWIAGAMIVADRVFRLNFVIQVVYFGVAGFVWVFPIRWLMLWSVHQR
jgi:hypothetical protein